MNKRIYLLILLPYLSFSQISITSTNLPNIGDTVIVSGDNGNFTAGLSGANQSWDFSNAAGNIEMLLGFIDPSITPYQAAFPNSNISVQNGVTFYYLNRSVNGLKMLGAVDSGMTFAWEQVMLPAPLNYLDTLSYTHVTAQIDTVFSPSIPSIYLDIVGPYVVDSATIIFGSLDKFIVDSWGQIQMPNATYNALRIFQSKYESENYLVRVTDTITGQSQWIQPPSSLYWEESRYLWRTNDSLVTWNLVEMETDSAGYPDGNIEYYSGNSMNNIIISPPMLDAELGAVSCANFADGFIILGVFGTYPPFTLSWSGPNGWFSPFQGISGLIAGTYTVTVTDANGNSTVETYIVTEPPPLTASIIQSGVNLIASANGGVLPYSYMWSTGDTVQTITPSSNGLYNCDIIDKLGCFTSITFNVGWLSVSVLEINSKKTLIKIVDVLGREDKEVQNGPLFYIYNNGTVEKKIILE